MLDNPLEFWYDESRLETRDSESRFDGAWFSWKFGTSVYRQHPSLKLKIEILCLSHIWGYSSAGRALEWHSRGQRFDPAYLHHERHKSEIRFRKEADFCLCSIRFQAVCSSWAGQRVMALADYCADRLDRLMGALWGRKAPREESKTSQAPGVFAPGACECACLVFWWSALGAIEEGNGLGAGADGNRRKGGGGGPHGDAVLHRP